MSSLEQKIIEALEEHVSPLTARSLLRRALERCDLYRAEEVHMPELIAALETGIRLFVAERQQQNLLERLSGLQGTSSPRVHRRIVIDSEESVREARMTARSVAASLGGDSFTVQKIVTAVSELARNIVLYASHGTIELESTEERRALRIVARDSGPGIRDLDAILAGRYRSRTGLGRGLRGVSQLASHFDVQTGPRGTQVTAEFEP